MAQDLDLALRISGDIKKAKEALSALRGDVGKTSGSVAAARGSEASSAAKAAAAAKELERAQTEVARETQKTNRATRDAAEAAEELERAEAEAAREIDEAARAAREAAESKDRAAGAAKEAARAENQAAAANTRAAATAKQIARDANTAAAAQTRQAQAARTAAAAQTGLSNRSRAAFQNVGYQVQDLAVQISGGTSAIRALSQQLPQLLSGLGPLGIALGTAFAVIAPLAAVLFQSSDAADDAGAANERLNDSVERLRSLRALGGDLDAVKEAYGQVTQQARDLIEAQRALELEQARRAARSLVSDLVEEASAVARVTAANEDREKQYAKLIDVARRAKEALAQQDIDPKQLVSIVDKTKKAAREALKNAIGQEELKRLAEEFTETYGETIDVADVVEEIAEAMQDLDRATRQAEDAASNLADLASEEIAELQDRFGLSEESAKALFDALQNLAQAEGTEAQTEAVGALREAITSAKQNAEGLTEAQTEAWKTLREDAFGAEEALLRLAGIAIGDLGLGEATGAASALADELERAVVAQAGLTARADLRLERARIERDFANDPDELRRRLRALHVREAVEPLERKLRADGSSELEIALDTSQLARDAGAEFDANYEADAIAETRRRGGRGGGARGDKALDALRRRLEQYENAADSARLAIQGLGDAEKARAVAAAEAARLAAEAIAQIGTGPGAAARIAEIRELEAALVAAAEDAAELERKMRLGPQGLDAARAALDSYAEDAINAGDEIANAVGGTFKGLEDQIVGFVTGSKLQVGDLANFVVAEFARIALRTSVTGPLSQAFSDAIGGFFGGVGARFGQRPSASAIGSGVLYHEGGVAGMGTIEAARHDLAPGEVPAILRLGEAILTSRHARALLGWGPAEEAARARDILARSARYHAGGVAEGRGAAIRRAMTNLPSIWRAEPPGGGHIPASAATYASGAPTPPPQSVEVQIRNEGGPRIGVRDSEAHYDGRRWVIGIITEDLVAGGQLSDILNARIRGGGVF